MYIQLPVYAMLGVEGGLCCRSMGKRERETETESRLILKDRAPSVYSVAARVANACLVICVVQVRSDLSNGRPIDRAVFGCGPYRVCSRLFTESVYCHVILQGMRIIVNDYELGGLGKESASLFVTILPNILSRVAE